MPTARHVELERDVRKTLAEFPVASACVFRRRATYSSVLHL